MFQILIKLGTLRQLYYFTEKVAPLCFILGSACLLYGGVGGLWLAPPDYQQGEGFRILYVHVPCAFFSLMIYTAMAVLSSIYLIWRVKAADVIAYCVAPIGTFLTLSALVTGAIWGKPMWGTWWIWDARLTSELILLFLYLGYMGLYNAIPHPKTKAKACAILACVGAVDIPIIHYSVYWWNTLHQGATLTQFSRPLIDRAMLYPLLGMLVGFACLILGVLCIRMRAEILEREQHHSWVRCLLTPLNVPRLVHGNHLEKYNESI